MSIKITREDTEDCKVAIFEPIQDGEPTIYDLAYLFVDIAWIRKYKLNELELLVFSFINSYKPKSGKIYFSNSQLGKMFDKSGDTISRVISSLKDKGIVEVELQADSTKGTVRYLKPLIGTVKTPRGVGKNDEGARQKCRPNSNINSNINNIYISFLEKFNTLLGTRYRGDIKSRKAFDARIKEGYTLEDFGKAIAHAKSDLFLMGKNDSGNKYLTPEYITRPDKLEKWLNQTGGDVKAGYK